VPQTAAFARNYIDFIRARIAAGGRVARFRAGRADQIRLLVEPARHPFEVRNLAAGGEVWTGRGEKTIAPIPPGLPPADIPDENVYSCAFRLTYGTFRYFTAGDLTSTTLDDALPWRDLESWAAQAAGPVDVAVAAHHGLFDSNSAEAVRALRPRFWLIDAWHVSHPGMTSLERFYSERLYPGSRDVISTGLSTASDLVNNRLTQRFVSKNGHIVVRVAEGGRATGSW
jgi:hypothetical protein